MYVDIIMKQLCEWQSPQKCGT